MSSSRLFQDYYKKNFSPLSAIPDEIKLKIFSKLLPRDKLSAMAVSWDFFNIIYKDFYQEIDLLVSQYDEDRENADRKLVSEVRSDLFLKFGQWHYPDFQKICQLSMGIAVGIEVLCLYIENNTEDRRALAKLIGELYGMAVFMMLSFEKIKNLCGTDKQEQEQSEDVLDAAIAASHQLGLYAFVKKYTQPIDENYYSIEHCLQK